VAFRCISFPNGHPLLEMMKTALLCLLLFAVGTFASPNEEHLPKFQEFIKNHRKVWLLISRASSDFLLLVA
jgi:hypothetical protein